MKKHNQTGAAKSPIFLLEMYIASVYKTYPHEDVLKYLDQLCEKRELRKPLVLIEEKKEKVERLLPTLSTPVAIMKEFGITYHVSSPEEADIMRDLIAVLLKISQGQITLERKGFKIPEEAGCA